MANHIQPETGRLYTEHFHRIKHIYIIHPVRVLCIEGTGQKKLKYQRIEEKSESPTAAKKISTVFSFGLYHEKKNKKKRK